jgi:hypothetical protein
MGSQDTTKLDIIHLYQWLICQFSGEIILGDG